MNINSLLLKIQECCCFVHHGFVISSDFSSILLLKSSIIPLHWEVLLLYLRIGYSAFDFVKEKEKKKKKRFIHCYLSKLFAELNMFWFLRCLIF